MYTSSTSDPRKFSRVEADVSAPEEWAERSDGGGGMKGVDVVGCEIY